MKRSFAPLAITRAVARGCGGFSNFRSEDGDSVEIYNKNRFLILQIESEEGLAILPEMLRKYKEEIAGVLIGPYDSSIMLGTPMDITSDKMQFYVKAVFDACRAERVPCGSYVDDAGLIDYYRDLGANVFWTGSELSLLSEACGNLCNAFNEKMKP